MTRVWLLENEQARWFEFEEPDDMPNDVTVTMLAETEQPAQRTWVGLTDEEMREIAKQYALGLAFPYDSQTTPEMFARAIESKLKEKNNG